MAKPIGYKGIVKVSSFATLLQPFFSNAENRHSFMRDMRAKMIPAVTDDLIFKDTWTKLSYDPNFKSNSTAYIFEAPASFIGMEGHVKGHILAKTQQMEASISLLPMSLMHSNLKIEDAQYNYYTNKSKISEAVGMIKY